MARNIKYQFLSAINGAFSESGKDKHSLKADGGIRKMEHVYSFKERQNLVDTASQLSNYVKEKYPKIRMVKDISPSVVQEFLASKCNSCSQQTLSQYVSRLNKIDVLVKKAYKAELGWRGEIVAPAAVITGKIRDVAMSREDFEKILEYGRQSGTCSQAPIAIELAGRFGMRDGETVKFQPRDINYDILKIHIHESKGGRSRDITFTKKDIAFLKTITEGIDKSEKVIKIKEDSINRYLQRTEEKLGIRQRYKDAKSGLHSIRKLRAQEVFDKCREKNMNIRDSLDFTAEYLGHGKQRDQCIKEYVLFVH